MTFTVLKCNCRLNLLPASKSPTSVWHPQAVLPECLIPMDIEVEELAFYLLDKLDKYESPFLTSEFSLGSKFCIAVLRRPRVS